MALPIVPLALVAGAVALAKNVHVSPVVQSVEDSLDTVEEGFAAHRDPDQNQINAAYRWKRSVRFGATGPAFEIDASALGRLRVKKLN